MASMPAVNERQMMRNHAVLTVTIRRPTHHRLLFWFGFRCMALGAWFAGFAETRIEETQE